MGYQPPRQVLKAGPKAVAHWLKLVQDAEAELEADRRASARSEAVEGERGLAQAGAVAEARGEEFERVQSGPAHVARDGLRWVLRKGYILPMYYDAGLRFRADYECANGTGVNSILGTERTGRGFDPATSGPTHAMLKARDDVRAALRGLGSPLLHGYITHIAGEGRTLTDPVFGPDPKRASEHFLPCRIAFDMLARHYGMIR